MCVWARALSGGGRERAGKGKDVSCAASPYIPHEEIYSSLICVYVCVEGKVARETNANH